MKWLSLSALLIGMLGISSCNTMIGIGRDMKIGGEGLENAANKVSGNSSDSSGTGTDTGAAPIY